MPGGGAGPAPGPVPNDIRYATGGLLVAVVAIAAAAGCYTGPHIGTKSSAPAVSVDGAEPAADLPCDVARILSEQCASCHGQAPTGGATLLSRADLTRASTTDPSKSEAQVSLDCMRDPVKPMPPSGSLAPEDLAIFAAWVDAGMPAGTCTSTSTDYATPSVCTSGTEWTRGNHGSRDMRPGGACIACHTSEDDAPRFTIAGTVYPTAHEPDDCYGSRGTSATTVVITGADGTSYSLPLSSAGNFSTSTRIKTPYRAKVVTASGEREMVTPQTNGDCNGCHTEDGDKGAPGRVMAPSVAP